MIQFEGIDESMAGALRREPLTEQLSVPGIASDIIRPGAAMGTVLVVDDEAAVRELLRQALAREAGAVFGAENAVEALANLATSTVDLVVLDINMPGISGLDLLKEIVESWPDVAVVMLTAASESESAVRCLKAGAYDYITKPFLTAELLLRLRQASQRRALLLERRRYQQQLEQRVRAQSRLITGNALSSIEALAMALDAKDPYTEGHSRRVAELSVRLAVHLGFGRARVESLRLAAMLHDIGKIGIPDTILLKPGRLDPEEFEVIKKHPQVGEKIVAPISNGVLEPTTIRHHHERFDGAGYPDGIEGCLSVVQDWEVLALADSYDAMSSRRPYREPLSREQIFHDVCANRGKQFHPEAVDAFWGALAEYEREKG